MYDNNEKDSEGLQVHTDKEDDEINSSSSSLESEKMTDLGFSNDQRSHERTNEESLLKQKTKKIVLAVIASLLALTLLILLFSCHFSKKTTADTETEATEVVETESFISSIHINTPMKTTIEVGDFLTLKASIQPNEADQTVGSISDGCVAWFSSSEEVATIDDEGRLGGLSEGETTITATSADGATDSIKITVEAKETEETTTEETTEVPDLKITEGKTTEASSSGSKWTGNSGNTSGGSSSGSSNSGSSGGGYVAPETEAPAAETKSIADMVSGINGDEIESYILQYLNEYRASAGIAAAQRDSDLDKVAQYRSGQLTTDYGHLAGDGLHDVCVIVGCPDVPLTGECISSRFITSEENSEETFIARSIASGWYGSASHWDVVSTCTKWGVGITITSSGDIYCSINVSNG